MAKPTLAEVKERAQTIYGEYSSHFAGRPRATRNVELLDGLIDRLERVVEDAKTLLNGSRNPAVMSILDEAVENLERYISEKREINKLTSDPNALVAAKLADRANRVFDRYSRLYAGKERGTRDRRLLGELVEALDALADEMSALENKSASTSSDLDTIRVQRKMYADEIGNIESAQRDGSTSERANRLASLANNQFTTYRTHFSGRSRLTRRPELLVRMSENLVEYQELMKRLQKSFKSDMNAKNIEIVQSNLDMYAGELVEIRKVREETSVRDLAGSLGGAANSIFEEYRENYAGKPRTECDPELLSGMCDRLAELAIQMREIAREIEIDFNEKNLAIVEETMATYEEEWRRVNEAAIA